MRLWALLAALVSVGCSSEKLVVWASAERLAHDYPAADVSAPKLLPEWEGWRPRSDWEDVSGWLRMTLDLPAGTYHYALQLGDQIVPDPLVAQSIFVRDPLGRSDDPYSTEVSEVELPAPAKKELPPTDGLVYQIMIDRFRGPDGALAAPDTPGDRAGGTLDGVTAAIEAGYFEKLGVTTLWLSPVYQNPDGKHLGRDGRLYEAYHGYWPSEPRTVEPKFGGEAALDRVVGAAHARGLRVILDAVPNHVHDTHPYWAAHAGWFNQSCVCGDPGCDWGSHIETCWFGPELPDLNWRDPDVTTAGVGDLVWWMQRFSVDGLRIDAVPMMPRAATRRIAKAVRALGRPTLLLGEDYTGPGEGGREEIRAYLGAELDGLDSAFDFPLMWASRQAIAQKDPAFGFDALEKEVAAGDAAWSGSGALIAHMLDNHDTTRFVSESAGDAGGDPWLAPPAQSQDPSVYARQLIGLTFVLTLPGLPVIYYGDEMGLAGATDPDSRRVLPDVLSPLPALQQQLLDAVARVGHARRCFSGDRKLLLADVDHDVALRGNTLVVLSRDAQPSQLVIAQSGRYRNLVTNEERDISGVLAIDPMTAAVWVPVDDGCLK